MNTIKMALRLGELIVRYYLIPKDLKISFFAQTGGHLKQNKHVPLLAEYGYHILIYGTIIYLIIPEKDHFMVLPTIIGSAISFTMYTMVGKLAKYLKEN